MMINGNKMLMAPLLERTLEMLKGRLSMRTLGNYRSSINKVRMFAGEKWNRLTMEEISKRWTDRFSAWLERLHGDKPQMVTDGHIRYNRSKTGAPIEVEVVPEIYEIMRRYHREDSPYVLPFLHEARRNCSHSSCFSSPWQSSSKFDSANPAYNELSEESALRRINRATREIGAILGLSVPLTTYVPRHTWATLMLEDGHPVELIGQCMGHTSIRTTQIYLSRISSLKVDSSVGSMYDRMLRLPKVKINKNKLPDKTLIETKKNVRR